MVCSDGTQIPWPCCPHSEKALHKVKVKGPSRNFNIHVGPTGEICSCPPSFPGTRNDKTMAHYNYLMQGLKNGTLYNHVEFELYTKSGVNLKERQSYGITDGGYHFWRSMIFPWVSSCPDEKRLAKRLESIRKISERVYGSLKKRFRCLANGSQHRSSIKIDNEVRFTCIIHNMLLRYDRYIF